MTNPISELHKQDIKESLIKLEDLLIDSRDKHGDLSSYGIAMDLYIIQPILSNLE